MKGFAPIVIVIAVLAAVPLAVQSNATLNFLIVALMIALAGQGWNILGGYAGQYSFGHAAFLAPAPMSRRSCRCATASMPGSVSAQELCVVPRSVASSAH